MPSAAERHAINDRDLGEVIPFSEVGDTIIDTSVEPLDPRRMVFSEATGVRCYYAASVAAFSIVGLQPIW